MGTKKWLVESSPYLTDFLVAANSAALPAHCDDWDTYDWATVSITVTSQSAHFPAFHGMSVIPSGRFPSLLDSPAGSFMEGTSARCNALAIKSLMALCLAWRTEPSLHESPCKPLASTIAPQTHWCGLHNAVPRRSPTATRTSSFSKRSPHETIGKRLQEDELYQEN